MLSADVHIGTRNSDNMMKDYIWRRRNDGIHILNIGQTWEKLMLAARVIAAIENPEDVIAISARPYGMRAVLKYAHYTGAQCISGRYTPGTFTNQITKQFREPRLLIITDPRTDSQPLRESSYVNLPVIAFCDSDRCVCLCVRLFVSRLLTDTPALPVQPDEVRERGHPRQQQGQAVHRPPVLDAGP